MKRLFNILAGLVVVAFSVILGFLIASKSVTFHVEVDYDSARCRDRVFVGPILVRDRPSEGNVFGSIRMPNGSIWLQGTEDWRPALIFDGNSQRSPTFDGGTVLYHLKFLESLPWKTSTDRAVAKQQFLQALSVDSTAAIRVVNSFAEKMRASEREQLKED